MDETKLVCPYCRASYQAKDSTCPHCDKALSPTGYSRYGSSEVPEQLPAPALVKPAVAIVQPMQARVGGIDRPRTRDTQIQAWRFYLPIGVIIVVIMGFFILNGQSRRSSISIMPPYSAPVGLQATPTPVRPFACLPPAEATLYPVLPLGAPTNDTQPAYAPRADDTPAPTTNRAANITISYILILSTTKGVLQAKMYDIGAASNLPQLQSLTGSHFGIGSGTVTLYTGDSTTSDFRSNNLPYLCGSLLVPVYNGKVAGDQLTIITSNVPSTTIKLLQSAGNSYLVVGQLISGYDVLDALTGSDSVLWWRGCVVNTTSDNPASKCP